MINNPKGTFMIDRTNMSRWIPQTVIISTSLYPPLDKTLLDPIDYTLEKVSRDQVTQRTLSLFLTVIAAIIIMIASIAQRIIT